MLFAYTGERARFVDALGSELCWTIPTWRVEEAERRQKEERQESEERAQRADSLSRIIGSIETGRALGALARLAKIFFGLFADVDREKAPKERVAAFVGSEYEKKVFAGFVAVLGHSDLPTPRMIGLLHTKSQSYNVGYIVLAGCDLVATDSMEAFSAIHPSTLRSALAFHLVNLTESKRPWVQWLKQERSRLAAETLLEFWAPQLEKRAVDPAGLYDLPEVGDGEVARRVVFPLLKRFPAAAESTLRLLLAAAIKHGDRENLLSLCGGALEQRGIRGPARFLWLATAFALSPGRHGAKLAKSLSGKREQARSVVDFLFSRERGGGELVGSFDVPTRGLLISLLGAMFPPRESVSGWRRINSDWEMSQVVRGLIDGLSGDVTAAAGTALYELLEQAGLAPWRDALSHAISVQKSGRREATFTYPSSDAVIQTFQSGRPANSADLQALVASECRTLAAEIRHGVTDGYKAFWNVDRHDRPIGPRPEDDCRDRLLERLRPRLLKSEVTLEPEGRYAEEKRSDIKAIAGALNIPVEVKRHYHRDLWSAPQRQLRRLYARDPGTGGRGIFLVFWFGLEVSALPRAPAGIAPPKTGLELLRALRHVVLPEDRALTEIVFIDCSRPRPGGSRPRSGRPGPA